MKKERNYAKSIGNLLAFIQSKVDDLFDYGFSKLSKVDEKKLPKDSNKVKKVLYTVGGFIGSVGKNYYKKYNEINEEKAKFNKK